MQEDDEAKIQALKAEIARLEEAQRLKAAAPIKKPSIPESPTSSSFNGSLIKWAGIAGILLLGLAVYINTRPPNSAPGHTFESDNQRRIAEEAARVRATRASTASDVSAPATAPSKWRYASDTDPMTDKTIHRACVTSTNTATQNWPYKSSSLDLCIRDHPKWGLDTYVRLNSDGQFVCHHSDCTTKIRFGTNAAQSFSVSTDAADGSRDIMFVLNESRFLSGTKGAAVTKIDVTLYEAGTQTIEFDTRDLEWPRPS